MQLQGICLCGPHKNFRTILGKQLGGYAKQCMGYAGHHLHGKTIQHKFYKTSKWQDPKVNQTSTAQTMERRTYCLRRWPTMHCTRLHRQWTVHSNTSNSCSNQQVSYRQTISFLGRDITNEGDHYEVNLNNDYVANTAWGSEHGNMQTSNNSRDGNIQDEHRKWRQHTSLRKNMHPIDESLESCNGWPTQGQIYVLQQRSSHAPYNQHTLTSKGWNIRWGTYKGRITSSYFASQQCRTTRKSTTGFITKLLGATVHSGSRAQSVVALSSAESELYASGTGSYASGTSWRKHSRQTNYMLESARIQQVAKALQQEPGHQIQQNTLTWITCSYNDWYTMAS